MMKKLHTLTENGKIFNDQNILFALVLILFLPNFIMYPALIVAGVFVFTEMIIKRDFKKTFVWVIALYALLVSLHYNNYFGCVIVFMIVYLIAYVGAIQRRMTPRNYMKMQYYIVWSSLLNFLFNFIPIRPQWFQDIINNVMGLFDLGHLPVWQLPPYGESYLRAYSTFDNPNFYAFILLIVLLVCFNQIQFQLTFKNYRLFAYYSAAFVINFYALILTGTRAILPALGVGLVAILLMQRKWNQVKFLVGLGIVGILVILKHPELFPRFEQIAEHSTIRINIWDSAMTQIRNNPWFGSGPMSYAIWFDNTHAHNMYIESLLSMGIIGSALIGLFLIERGRYLYKYGYYLDYPLALSMLAALFVYAIFDFPFYYFQTSALFVAVFCLPDRRIKH